jgi:hypothetical protein
MTSILNEKRLTLTQAARWLGVHTSTPHRWHMRGVRGIRLSTALVGGVRYTSEERLLAFIEATTAAANGTVPPPSTSVYQQKAFEAAKDELAKAGI